MTVPKIIETPQKAPQLEKAKLIARNKEAPDIILMFNPEEITFARTVKWEAAKGGQGKTLLPKVNFSGVDPYKFTLKQLVFDTYESKESVMGKINDIKRGVTVVEGLPKKRPPIYLFAWGNTSNTNCFNCVITSLTYKLNMFLTDGTPVRAIVDISLQEVDESNVPGSTESKSQDLERVNGPTPPNASKVDTPRKGSNR
jgi:Contractile injection system tube protein